MVHLQFVGETFTFPSIFKSMNPATKPASSLGERTGGLPRLLLLKKHPTGSQRVLLVTYIRKLYGQLLYARAESYFNFFSTNAIIFSA